MEEEEEEEKDVSLRAEAMAGHAPIFWTTEQQLMRGKSIRRALM